MSERFWGIDVSYHNGTIDWKKVKETGIEFAILRAGYSYTIDSKFKENAEGCRKNKIPFGVYWFSYALNPEMAIKEAKTCLSVISSYNLSYPVCFDFEYDSLKYAEKNNVKLSSKNLQDIARAFLTEIEKNGYYAMNYTNLDFISKGFGALTSRFDTWLAQWNSNSEPSHHCGIWQYSSTGEIPGISGKVDLDCSFKDYPSIINRDNDYNESENNKEKILEKINEIKKAINELEGML